MAGMDRMIRHIREDAELTASRKIREARGRGEEILRTNREALEKRLKESETEGRRRAELLLERGRSTALLEEKKKTLALKQEMIGEILRKARERLLELDDRRYFRLILRMAARFIRNGKGTILFSEKDRRRLPENFQEKLTELAEKAGGELRISPETREMDGGFILVYGGIEVNGSFSAVFQAEENRLRDLLNRLLFLPEEERHEE